MGQPSVDYHIIPIELVICPRANGAKRRSGGKPGARVTHFCSAIYTRVNANIAKCKVILHVMDVGRSTVFVVMCMCNSSPI